MNRIDAAMMERAESGPTMEEIVVALRETRRGAGRAPFTLVDGQAAGPTRSGAAPHDDARGHGDAATDAGNVTAGSTDIAELRDGEVERLLATNARLNERVVFLLKIIEREQAHIGRAAETTPEEAERAAISREVKGAVQAELRPVLQILLRLLERQSASPAAAPASVRAGPEGPRSPAPSEWIVELIRKLDREGKGLVQDEADFPPPRPGLRRRIARAFDALRL